MKYFTISEFIRSDKAIKNRIWNGANREQEDNIIALVDNVLDPLREKYGKPIRVSSGFRCPAVNSAVGGVQSDSKKSQHEKGEAADIVSSDGTKGNYSLARLIAARGNFDQMILEDCGKNDLYPAWVHVSWKRTGSNRREIRKKVKGVNAYPVITLKDLGLN